MMIVGEYQFGKTQDFIVCKLQKPEELYAYKQIKIDLKHITLHSVFVVQSRRNIFMENICLSGRQLRAFH